MHSSSCVSTYKHMYVHMVKGGGECLIVSYIIENSFENQKKIVNVVWGTSILTCTAYTHLYELAIM